MATPSIDQRLDALAHARRVELDRLRAVLRGLDPRVVERWKWNAPSFALDGDFATFRLQPRQAFQLVLHTGATPRDPARALALTAPPGLLDWPARDRCVLALARLTPGAQGEALVAALARDWLSQLGRL